MSWEIVVLIALGVIVLLSVPVILLMWRVSKRSLQVFDDVSHSIRVEQSFKEDPFDTLDARVKKMTGPGSNPFGKA